MPPVVAAAAIGAGASIYGASQAKKASNKALAAQNAASQQQIAAQQAALDRITNLNQPFINGGAQAYSALLAEFGIGAPGGAPAAAPAPVLSYDRAGNAVRSPTATPTATQIQAAGNPNKLQGGPAGTSPLEAAPMPAAAPAPAGPDWKAYSQQYGGDVAQEFQRLQSTPEGQQQLAAIGATTPDAFAEYHYNTFGQQAGRTAPQMQAQASAGPQAPPQVDPNAAPDLANANRPGAAPPPSFAGQAPDSASYYANFEADPGAAYRRTQALDGVNAASAARGKLRSGDAVKALATLSSDLASQEYNNWFSRQTTKLNGDRNAFQNDRAYDTGMWQYGVDRGDRNFNTDRGFQTQQDNTRIGNLFDLTRVGTSAAGNVSGAVTNNANNQSNIFGSQAQNAADAANARANANSGLAGSLAGTATSLFTNWGGGGSSTNAAQPFNQQGFNAWAQGNW